MSGTCFYLDSAYPSLRIVP